ncbi:unnamed protein product [Blepharisma stoltei]|uniref:PDEase domain-containing protein n=1 Tax=Blepharisma stoltei TaxID=1481888 RepID=A0AAU9JCK2_9CILI|nr:unnamed protein product [Blepharisma stoltei]
MESQQNSDKLASEPGFYAQTNHSVYALLGHEDNENIALPINPNFLTYKEGVMNKRYMEALYLDKTNHRHLSREFINNLLTFYLFITSYIIISVVTWSLLYSSDDLCKSHYVSRMVLLGIILIFAYGILFSIWKYHSLIYYSQYLYGALGFFIMLYLVLCDENILSGISGNPYNSSTQSHVLVMACFIVLLRIVTFDNFVNIAAIFIVSLILLLACFIAFTTISVVAVLSDFFILLVFCVLQLVESRQVEFRAKQLFWRKAKEEEALNTGTAIVENEINNYESVFKPEIEIIFKNLDKIKENIKAASVAIMFADVKTKLKVAASEIEKIKRKLVHGALFDHPNIQKDKNMDDEDLTFILENFVDGRHGTLQRVTVRRKTMLEVVEKKPSLACFGASDLERILSGVGVNWKFDIWFVYHATSSSVWIISKYLLQKWDMNALFNIPEHVSDTFFQALEKSYNKDVPYHNSCHAADVLHSLLYFLIQSNIFNSLSPLETIAAMVAALGHDVGHPGLNTRFLINSRNDLALQYNDFRVLENMHAAKTFALMKEKGHNIFQNLSNDDWIKSRKLIIEMILHTDMTMHFEALGKFNTRLNLGDLSLDNHEDKFLILSMGLKCADIGHSAKIPQLHEKWSLLLIEEFFKQGDLEKEMNMQVSMYCDRRTCDINKSQAGFIKNICIPLFESWCKFLRSDIINVNCIDQLNENWRSWEEKAGSKLKRPNSILPNDSIANEETLMNHVKSVESPTIGHPKDSI